MIIKQDRRAFTITIIAVLLISTLATAEEQQEPIEDQSRRARAMYISGIVLTSLGAAGIIIGVGFMIEGFGSTGDQGPAAGLMAFGIIGGGSTVPLAIGIPLWAVGKKRKDRLASKAMIPRFSVAMDYRHGNYLLLTSWSFWGG